MTAANKPQSKLFLSCDLTGSTNFKQAPPTSTPWQKVFLQFYREFPQELRASQEKYKTTHLKFLLWKPVGDELIFTCDVNSEKDIHDAIKTWVFTMETYTEKSLHGTALGTKGGAFIATFPGPDSRSTIPRNPVDETSGQDVVKLNRDALKGQARHGSLLYDYFGPSIDTGFRVFSKCDSRYFTMSVEVSFALACFYQTPGPQANYELPPMRLLHSDGLKGVWANQRYPVFALDLFHDSAVHKAFAPFDDPVTGIQQIHDLCEACYASENWPFALYLSESGNDHFKKEPVDPLADYLDRLDGEDKGETTLSTSEGELALDPKELPTGKAVPLTGGDETQPGEDSGA